MLRHSVGLAILMSVVAGPISAQESTSIVTRDGWIVSIGADPTQRTGGRLFAENLVGALAKEWTRANSRLGFRAQVMGGRVPTRHTFLATEPGAPPSVSERRSFAELSAAATYTFRRDRSFSPYLLAGPALYAVRSSYSVRNAVIGAPGDGSSSTWSLGAAAGAGLNMKILGKDILIEQRMLIPEPSTARRGNLVVSPFTLGIRF